jgi:outer membrane cobalamin receptor
MEEIVITPGRLEQPQSEVPESVTVIGPVEVRRSAAQTVDDLLRQVPGFSLFRRSSSVVTHPTTQGVSLRGVGPSGASRTLVLLDGIPLNDPFGGWVYWSRVPVDGVERIEVVRGGGSGVWGNSALGGVVQILTRRPAGRSLRFTAEGGSRDTWRVDAGGTETLGPVAVDIRGSFFDTGGYPIVRQGQRGAIDEEAASKNGTFRGEVRYEPRPGSEMRVEGGFFSEERENGTPLTGNETELGTIGASGRGRTTDGSEWILASFGQVQTFSSTFSSQEPDRSAETPALDQFDVPSSAVGASAQWIRRFGEHLTSVGTDARWVDGETNEDFRFFEGRFTRRRKAGGEQHLVGLFGEDVWTPIPRLHLTVAARGDLWRNVELFRRERSLEDGSVLRDDSPADRDRIAFSPRFALVHRTTDRLSFRGSVYRGFRAPTLNELVRPFRVRNDITEANAGLDPERLLGGELGATFDLGRFRSRITGFWNHLEDPIANVTVADGPGLIEPCGFVPEGGVCRQRRNLEAARIRGIETEVGVIPARWWRIDVSHLLSDAVITDASTQPALEGRRLAQVPKHQIAVKLSWDDPTFVTVALQVRYLGRQFEDDQNTTSLGDYAVVDLFLGREIFGGVELFLAGENLFDRTFAVGKTADGLVTVGAPLLVHGGVRLRLS